MSDRLAATSALLVAGAVVLLVRPSVARAGRVARQTAVRPGRAPALGGLAILLAVVIASLAFVPFDEDKYRGILIGVVVAAVVGILADTRVLSPPLMFAGQVGAALVPVAYGVTIERFTFPGFGVVTDLPGWVGGPVAVAWIVVLMRLVDFVDGVDGLAAAVCGAAGLVFIALSLGLGDRSSAILSAIIAGASIAFVWRNFYPASIVLGHLGALVLGFLVGAVTLAGLLKTAAVVGVFFPLAVLAVPALDTSSTVGRVLSVFPRADTEVQRTGRARDRTTLALVIWCTVVTGCAVASSLIAFRAGGQWHAWKTAAVALLAVVAVVASVYVIALIEQTRRVARVGAHGARPRLAPPPAVASDTAASGEVAIAFAQSASLASAHRRGDAVIRTFDIVLAGLALAVLSPLLLAIAGVVLVTSGRPIVHAGDRVGRNGSVFTMPKFRTLLPDADQRIGGFYGAALDERVARETTRVGRVLRKTHLDELPQLWCVLVGDMSIVGPRPLRPRFFEELCAEIPGYWQRLTVRPGLTGLAQIRIDRGPGWDEKLAHDLEWIADRSVRLYLATIVQTAWQMLRMTASRPWRHAT